RNLIENAFNCAGIKLRWEGEGMDEKGYDSGTGRQLVGLDPKFYRPAEVDLLIADPSNAMKKLGWVPEVSFEQLVEMMVKSDLEINRKLKGEG
ncbi:MAG TPA: GDP-mannose 4,6-dehydratase, partial [Nitrospirota bacterium]